MHQRQMPRLIAIVGPTAAGKTALAVSVARTIGGEIVSADSRQVYKGMDIGTAKPSPAERAAVPHHLIDVVDPDEQFSLGTWLELAQSALADIWSRGRQPLLVGGTGQYVWALLEGWRVPRVAPNAELRARLQQKPATELLEELERLDPEALRFIDPRNLRRVVRALEVCHATGKPFSWWRAKGPPAFQTLILGLRLPREELYRRIDDRVDAMIAAGLVDEVRSLLAAGYSPDLPSMSGIGYKEICQHLAGEIDLATAVQRTKWATHRFARHQQAWFKSTDSRIQWVETPAEARALAESFLETGAEASGTRPTAP